MHFDGLDSLKLLLHQHLLDLLLLLCLDALQSSLLLLDHGALGLHIAHGQSLALLVGVGRPLTLLVLSANLLVATHKRLELVVARLLCCLELDVGQLGAFVAALHKLTQLGNCQVSWQNAAAVESLDCARGEGHALKLFDCHLVAVPCLDEVINGGALQRNGRVP